MPKKKKGTGTAPAAGYAEDPGDAELSAAASAGAWTKVQPWFQRRGGVADPAKIALREADGDRNVVAISGLSKGEAIFRVPAQIWFTAEGLSSHEAGRAVLKWAEQASEEVGLSAEHVELCLLAVLILLEGARSGFWSDYIAALPWSTSLPLSWTPERLSTLNGAAPQWQIQEKKSQLARAYSSVTDALQAAAKSAFQSACPNSDMFIKAFSLAHSRAMGIRSVGDQGRRWNLAMLPFVDMLNHSRQPEVGWDVVRTKDAGLCVVGRTLCDVKAGTELRIRYQFASAQAFFATYGFVEAVEAIRPTELRLAIDSAGGPAVLNVTSAQSLRKLLSRCRVQVATAEELKGAHVLEDAARFPLSQRCEIAAFRHLQDLVQQHVQERQMWSDGVDGMVRRLRDADGTGWRRLDNFVQSVLESIQEPGNELSAARLAVLVHSRMPICTGDAQRPSQSDTFVSQKMSIRDEGGEKGRGYFANRSISAGELLLSEEPHVFNPDDDDFGAVAAVHVLAAEEEGSELRVPAAESDGISEAEAFRWLSGIPSLTKEKAAKALAAARNNGFCTSLQSTGEEVWLLFRKLSVFNHSCWPSCSVYRDPSTGISHVLAIRPVDKGTELTIHYADDLILLPKELRKAFLPGRFGFACECDRCEEEDQAAAKVENLLLKHAEGRSDTWQEETQLAHAMKTAHAGLCKMRQERGRPAGVLLLVAIVSYWKNAACNIRRVCARALIQVWPCRSCPAPDFSKLLWLAASQGGVASARPRIMNQLGLRDGQQTAAKGRTAEEGEGESAKPLARQLFTFVGRTRWTGSFVLSTPPVSTRPF
ncbi:RBCMT [Symbiodinium sp. CCMP2592]|nr:RBCMT [Symbiodinium sp. CCMP2592]